jgi:hypothetical protein
MGLAIAATADVHRVPMLTENVGDFQIISDLVDVPTPRLGLAHTRWRSAATARCACSSS